MPLHNEPIDDQFLKLLSTDSQRAMELIFREYYTFLCQVIARILPDPHVAEDLAQDVFFEVWKKKETLNINTSVKAYLRRAAVNKTLNYVRDRKIRWDDEDKIPGLAYETSDVVQKMQEEELQAAVDAAIGQLPERCRLVFSLSRFEDMTYQEIAGHLGISVKTVENQMGKALRIMREKLGDYLTALLF